MSWPLSRFDTCALAGVMLLIVVVLTYLLRPTVRVVTDPPACTTTITPTSGSVQGWLAQAQPGQVLCLEPGTYTAAMLFVDSNRGGAEGNPLWIRASQEGTVLIDGQYYQRPVDCLGHDVVFWGLTLKNGNDHVAVLRGTRCHARRLVAYSTDSDLSHHLDTILDIGGSHNLCEDCVLFGYARKGIAAGARGGNGPNTVRRAWVELNGYAPTATSGNPTNVTELGYEQNHVTIENVIAHRDIFATASEPEAPFSMFSTTASAILGSIAYLKGGENFEPGLLMFVFPEGGSHAGSGHVTSQSIVKDVVTYAVPGFAHVSGFYIQGGSGSQGNVADNVVGVGPAGGGSCDGSGWTCTNLKSGTSLTAALGAGKTIWDSVPGVCQRIVNRVQTSEPLWPWSMNQRLSDALVAVGRAPMDLTATMEQLFGHIPAACTTGGTPIPPEPPTPGTPLRLTCTGQVTAVPGSVALECVQREGR